MLYYGLPKSKGIYMITNQNTEKSYIGKGFGKNGIQRRVRNHLSDFNLGRSDIPSMQEDWNLCNKNWTCKVLELTEDSLREEYWIRYYQTHVLGYNTAIGLKISESTRQKMRETRKGTNIGELNPRFGKTGTMLGKKHTDEACKKIKDALNDPFIQEKRILTRKINRLSKQINSCIDRTGSAPMWMYHELKSLGEARNNLLAERSNL